MIVNYYNLHYNTADFKECSLSNGGCEQICIERERSHECSCRDGFVLGRDGRTCDDTDECSLVEMPCNQTCINLPGGFRCECREGYVPGEDRTSCEGIIIHFPALMAIVSAFNDTVCSRYQ